MSVTAQTTLQFLWKDRSIDRSFRTGVSLHSHTMCSEESLEMVPRYTAKVPYLGRAIQRQRAEYVARRGTEFDFGQAFWTPPLAPRQAYRLEEKQIQRQLELPALVSLTDHDDIRASTLLHVMERFRKAPISTEWTIPFRGTFFHLGVHNLPSAHAASMMERLARFTAEPNESDLTGCVEMLASFEDVLLVLNHPLWDEKGIGIEQHEAVLRDLLSILAPWLHALELNGLRSWDENKQVIATGRAIGLPLISGGDRHGREPNAILNFSRAGSFPDFVREIRIERRSHVVFMPQYHEPLKLRVLHTMVDIVRDYPENAIGRRSWSDRVFYRDPEKGTVVPLRRIWNDGGPAIVRQFVATMQFLEWRWVRSALRVLLNDRAVVWPDQEMAVS